MKKVFMVMAIALSFISINADEMFSKVASGEPTLIQEGAKKQWCPVCGMSLKLFYKTSHAVNEKQFCSMRCLLVDMEEHNVSLDAVQVVDSQTEKLIPAKSAFYVVGSEIEGTMSEVSKLAFGDKKDAEAFIEEYDGEIMTFEAALEQAKRSLANDMAMVQAKKTKQVYPMGEKIFTKMCQHDINLTQYHAINELKAALKDKQLCKTLNPMQHQAVSLYLWEVKRVEGLKGGIEIVHVEEGEKCPVCGMFVYKYPKWAAQIFYRNEHFSFDGVKDMMKFYFSPRKWGKYEDLKLEGISKILVTDYYSQKAIDGRKAYYVIGSDVLGPMGHELIPFAQQRDAQTFMNDHHGKSIVTFDTITVEEVYALDQ